MNAPATTQATKPTTEPTASRAVVMTVALLALVVVAVVVIALLVSGGDGDSDDATNASTAESARIPTTGTLRQVSFAEGAGVALERLDNPAADPAVGAAAPDITASYFDNAEVTIDMSDGTPRLVMFFAHWCPHCQAEVTELVQRFERTGLPEGVELLAISTSVDQGAPNYPASDWFIDEGWPIPVLRDSESSDLATAYGLSGFPFAVAVDGDGNVVARSSGQVPEAQLNAMIQLATG